MTKHRAGKTAVLCLSVAVAAAGTISALAADIAGVASTIDGDTIEIHGQRIRLHGIDAPESNQRCLHADGEFWACGREASFALADLIGRRTVHCERTDTDHYGRVVAVCSVGDRGRAIHFLKVMSCRRKNRHTVLCATRRLRKKTAGKPQNVFLRAFETP